MENEIWKDCIGWEGIYQVSNFARVKSLSREITYISSGGKNCFYTTKETILRQYDCVGYFKVQFFKDAKGYRYFVHRLVAINFIDNPLDKPEVNHKDGNRQNNNISNLEWVSGAENKRHGYYILRGGIGAIGSDGIMNFSPKKVIQFSKDGIFIKEWESASDAKRALGKNSCHITECAAGKLPSAYGYVWKYKY